MARDLQVHNMIATLLMFAALGVPSSAQYNAPCSNYTVLSDAWRAVRPRGDVLVCDDTLLKSGVWYRLIPPAGNRIPETPPPIHSCGTHAPMWMNGAHPTTSQHLPVQRTLCAHWSGNTCIWSMTVNVILCSGGYYVYMAPVVAGWCSRAWCAENAFIPTGVPLTTVSLSTAPPTYAPRTTAPPTTAPSTTAPPTTAPRTTAPPTTAPSTTAPPTTAPRTTAPPITAPSTTAPSTTAPPTTAPRITAPPTTVPCITAPPSTALIQRSVAVNDAPLYEADISGPLPPVKMSTVECLRACADELKCTQVCVRKSTVSRFRWSVIDKLLADYVLKRSDW